MFAGPGVTGVLGAPLTEAGVAVIPLNVPEQAICVGAFENLLQFEVGEQERSYEMPFFDGGRVRIEQHRLTAGEDGGVIRMVIPDDHGSHVLEVTAEQCGKRWFAVGRPAPYRG